MIFRVFSKQLLGKYSISLLKSSLRDEDRGIFDE